MKLSFSISCLLFIPILLLSDRFLLTEISIINKNYSLNTQYNIGANGNLDKLEKNFEIIDITLCDKSIASEEVINEIKSIIFFDNVADTIVPLDTATDRGKIIKANQKAGALREAAEKYDLLKAYPKASVQSQHYLRDDSGRIAKDPLTGKGRRIDFVVIQDSIVIDIIETTSKTANKNSQIRKEERIRESGGAFIRDKRNGKLIDIKDKSTRISRRD